MELYVKQLQLGSMENFVYLVGAAGSPETAVIDAAWDVPAVLKAASDDGRKITHALVSHHHFDHVNGLPDVLGNGGIRPYIHAGDAHGLADEVRREVTTVSAGEVIEVGPLRIHALHTPGHTPGSTCWHAEGALFAGDTVFVNGCGRCDFPGGSAEQMFDSLTRVSKLPEETKLYPGHDYGDIAVSSVAREKSNNPYFQKLSNMTDFIAWRMRPRR
jgi:hydroxyacylglutathione hydrolase